MNYKLNQDTFFVNEIYSPKLKDEGEYYYYILTKKGVSNKELEKYIPRGNTCGIKDKNATTVQWFCTTEKIEKATLLESKNKEIKVKFKGKSDERLFVGKHEGNKFEVKVNLSEEEYKELKSISNRPFLVCNYFGEQRFDDRVFQLKELLENEFYQDALKFVLTEESKFDSETSTLMKKIIEKHFGDWKKILSFEVINNSGKKGLFEFLNKRTEEKKKLDENDFKEAFRFVEKNSFKFSLKAIQSKKFNELVNIEAIQKGAKVVGLIKGVEFLFDAKKSFKRQITVPVTEFEKSFGLKELERNTYFQTKFKLNKRKDDYWILFDLEKGAYATVVLEYLKNYLKGLKF
ncbi:MAG: tRNA pseudouridine(13) synthase TruD [Candidatus ainarchaeum sp.]|nr:tRNA pseudouridine(13) synthase TruD [Candidatus ainarchaeum sp.]